MERTLGITVFAVVLTVQLLMGWLTEWRARGLARRFTHQLNDSSNVIDLLERYIRIYEPLNIKVDAPIWQPVLFRWDVLMLNKRYVHHSNLYISLLVITQILLGRKRKSFLRNYQRWQVAFYLLSLVLAYMGLVLSPLWLVPAVVVQIGLVVASIVMFVIWGELLVEVLDVAIVLLDLNDIERKKAKRLLDMWGEEVFKYPFTPVRWLIRFVVPRRLGG